MNNIAPIAANLPALPPSPPHPHFNELSQVLLPRVLSNAERLDNGVSLLKAVFQSNSRQQLIDAITANAFHPNAIAHIEEFLLSDGGLVGEMASEYEKHPNHPLSGDHVRLVNWALDFQGVPLNNNNNNNNNNPVMQGSPLIELRTELASAPNLTEAMYQQLDALSRVAVHHLGPGAANPWEPIRVALAKNIKASAQRLTQLTQPQETPKVRKAAINNETTPEAAVQACLLQDEDSSVLLEAARRKFPKRSADTEPTEGEIQLRNRNIEGLNEQLDRALIQHHGASRRLFF